MGVKSGKQALPPRLAWASMALVALLLLGQPMMVYGQAGSPGEFCEQVSVNAANFPAKFAAGAQSGQQQRAALLQERVARWAEQDANRMERVSASRSRLAERVATLSQNVTTAPQAAAVAAFTATVQAAIVTRTAAIEATVSTFRADVVKAGDSRTAQAGEAIDRFGDAVSAAFAQAQAGCGSGASPLSIGPALQGNIAAAKVEFQAAINALLDVKAMVESSRPALKGAIDQAVAEFKATVEAAAEELKAAFGPG